jgi:4'-phosphopantetheinyl transferase
MNDWLPPPADPDLPAGELHAWLIPVDATPSRLAELLAILSPDEQTRAARFRFERDRIRFAAARGALRQILSRYSGRAPADLTFEYSRYGKPALANGSPLSFNISHSGDWAICAVMLSRRLGVDIELLRPDLASDTIAERFFSPREVATLRSLPEPEQPAAFFRCWTRKEAFVKARGEGLSLPLDRFDVSLRAGEPAALLSTLDDPLEAARWSLAALPAPPGYEATVAVEGPLDSARIRQFLEKP